MVICSLAQVGTHFYSVKIQIIACLSTFCLNFKENFFATSYGYVVMWAPDMNVVLLTLTWGVNTAILTYLEVF